MNKFLSMINKPFQLISKAGKVIDTTITTAEKGYKYMKLLEAFIKHLKAFNEDRKRILGVEKEVEPKTESNGTITV